jgi:hypothetical protein
MMRVSFCVLLSVFTSVVVEATTMAGAAPIGNLASAHCTFRIADHQRLSQSANCYLLTLLSFSYSFREQDRE